MLTVNIIAIASVAHATNKAWCEAHGDMSQPDFLFAPEWQIESAVNGVQHILDNPNSTPEDSHNNWLKMKIAEGWVYGEEKDADTKTHPCIMEYNELPAMQKVKDALFQSTVRALIDYYTKKEAADLKKSEATT